jgi:hypothetical protein
MSELRVQDGRVVVGERKETPGDRVARQRVNKTMEQLGDVVFKQPPTVGVSAMVSLLAIMVAVMLNALSEVKNISAVLEELVRMNLSREEALIAYRV